ncbi:MAG: 2-hydroxy-3-oxopropionate reductase [SAR202 cluster bacterium]|nr:2-hydroxy-3-oxopropionate reductase [SAR202 cluster bacterium]MDP6300688.1 2-hydroxy-3-oxopropionate reductase [SAR202 cluster bacterium]MDP7104310.1 2-hydroxy-3-oxopropionate reductase [SAR202 cluster bacterium]MDP7225902.1 2-hydroxy-3-oxopropionate reductase [SAR202 cluster bacterium]MDP7412248.1 2-hydroxy-3-oxopropionate reductase [SAR202 cluster bacterium]
MPSGDIGLIGLGIMGKPMARNMMKAGYSVTVYDIVGAAVEEVVTDGAASASSAREVAEKAPVVITMVPDSADSEAAILGPNGVLEGASAGHVVVDMSSIAPGSSQKIAAACEAQGVAFLDAPVSGGEPGAVAGTLAIMVGGKKDVFDAQYALMESMGGSIVLCGDYGAGNTTKLANQIIVAANIEAVGEALTLTKKAGLDPQVVLEAIQGGLAGSTVLNAKGPMMIEGNFTPGFRIRLHHKDLNNALITAQQLGVGLPVTGLVQQMIVSLMNDGKADEDHSAIANFIEEMSGTTISGK